MYYHRSDLGGTEVSCELKSRCDAQLGRASFEKRIVTGVASGAPKCRTNGSRAAARRLVVNSHFTGVMSYRRCAVERIAAAQVLVLYEVGSDDVS